MMHYYSTVDGIVTTHSGLEEDEKGMPCVRIHFERPRKDGKSGFDFADGRIPHFNFQKAFGFDEDEIFRLREYMRNNSSLLWEFAEKGGGENA